jgi:hypothetical protein
MLLIAGSIILAVALIAQLFLAIREYYWLRRQSKSDKIPSDVRSKMKAVIGSTGNRFIAMAVVVLPMARLALAFARHVSSTAAEYAAILTPLLGATIWLYFIYSRLRVVGASVRQKTIP